MGELLPCPGAKLRSEHATFDQRWCLIVGRYCKHAAMQRCERRALTEQALSKPSRVQPPNEEKA
jgi:hypothetical protein